MMQRQVRNVLIILLFTALTTNTVSYNLPFLDAVTEPELCETYEEALLPTRGTKKEWTFITYMAADNDLAMFAKKNLSQQAHIGSNNTINIVVHLDTRVLGNKKITKRYFVKKNQLVITNPKNQISMDSGNPETLVDCCKWAIKNYPANHYALILWNHGTGIIDIDRPRTINPSMLFSFNPTTNLIDLDRSIPFLQFLKLKKPENQKGICFDDTTGHYLTNQGLEKALDTVCKEVLKGQKFSIIGFDACLMSMLEVANITKNYTDYIVSSQEVELGTGWPYHLILDRASAEKLTPAEFAAHIVHCYDNVYSQITHDFTQSALKLSMLDALEEEIDKISELLILCLKGQQATSVRDAIRASKHKLLCTHFDEPSYIDLGHFLKNLRSNLGRFRLQSQSTIVKDLAQHIKNALAHIDKLVIANRVGKNLTKAHGLSIFFPERRIHRSYRSTSFAKTNKWPRFLHYYLGL